MIRSHKTPTDTAIDILQSTPPSAAPMQSVSRPGRAGAPDSASPTRPRPAGGKSKPSKPSTPSKALLREPGQSEVVAIDRAKARLAERRKRVQLTVAMDGAGVKVGPVHSDSFGTCIQLRDVFGTTSDDFVDQAIHRLVNIVAEGEYAGVTGAQLNTALAAVDGMSPRDETEAMLAIQMFATHETAMVMLTHAKRTNAPREKRECGALAVKLLKTYTAQVEALARLRRGGEQRVTVEHVHVHEGGQAIVGAVNAKGGG